MRARWYSPETGTFLSIDPIEGEPPYLYVRGNPINFTDRSGKQPPTWCIFAAFAWATDGPIPAGDVVTIYCGIAYAWAALGLGYVVQNVEFPGVDAPPRPTYPTDEPIPIPAPVAPPYSKPCNPYWSADGCNGPISAIQPGSAPEPEPNPTPTVPGIDIYIEPTCTPDDDEKGYKVLILGDGNFSYSYQLHARHLGWKITGTEYGNGSNSQTPRPGGIGNLKLYTNVDGTQLETGPETAKKRYDAIVFNAPRAIRGWKQESGDLVDDVLRSAWHVLKPGGHVRFSSTTGMPAGLRLIQRTKSGEWPLNYSNAYKGGRYYDDRTWGVPYQPLQNDGTPLTVKWDKFYWWIFVK